MKDIISIILFTLALGAAVTLIGVGVIYIYFWCESALWRMADRKDNARREERMKQEARAREIEREYFRSLGYTGYLPK